LGNDQMLTLNAILSYLELAECRLVVLSACETGMIDLHYTPNEFVGLPSGFLQAGAAAVVSSLWTVDDRSTTLLMQRFYHNQFQDQMNPSSALREAQIWLRDLSENEEAMPGSKTRAKFKSPYFWAPFVYYGI